MAGSITEILRDCGIEARLIPVSALTNVREEYEQFDHSSALWKEYYSFLELGVPEDMRAARSILVAAMPSNAIRLTFYYGQGNKSFLVPPTYLLRERQGMKERVESVFLGFGIEARQVFLPHKLSAVISSLAVYGRNNIAYIEGIGSYALLQTYITAAEPENGIHEVRFAEKCETCSNCAAACLTGAISKSGYKINARLCITTKNEGEEPFPEWIPSAAHNCIVGCMRCQRCCPMNKGMLKTQDGPVFDESETQLILSGTPFEQLSEHTALKMKEFDYYGGSFNAFVRNVRALLENIK